MRVNSSSVENTKRKHTMRYQSASLMYDTFGMLLFWMFMMVVVVNTEVIPKDIEGEIDFLSLKVIEEGKLES